MYLNCVIATYRTFYDRMESSYFIYGPTIAAFLAKQPIGSIHLERGELIGVQEHTPNYKEFFQRKINLDDLIEDKPKEKSKHFFTKNLGRELLGSAVQYTGKRAEQGEGTSYDERMGDAEAEASTERLIDTYARQLTENDNGSCDLSGGEVFTKAHHEGDSGTTD